MSKLDAYVRAALFGLGIYFSAVLIILVAIIFLSPSDIAFPIILGGIGLIVVAVLRYLRRWGLIIAGPASIFGMLAFSPDALLTLSTPEAFFDFLFTLFIFTGLIICLVACVLGSISYFRGSVATEVAPRVMMALRGIVAVITVLALVSIILTVLNATDKVSAADKEGAIELTAKDTSWSSETLNASAGQPIRLLIKNDDPTLHTFTMKDAAKGIDIDVRLGPWSEQIVEVPALQAGIYGFICEIEGHAEDMTGAIVVK